MERVLRPMIAIITPVRREVSEGKWKGKEEGDGRTEENGVHS